MRHPFLPTIAVVLSLLSPAARAQQILGVSGAWTAVAATTTDDPATARRMCAIFAVDGARGAATGHSVFIKAIDGREGLLFQVFSSAWRIPATTEIPFSLRIDGGAPVTGVATGGHDRVSWSLDEPDVAMTFIRGFIAGNAATLRFGVENEAPWSLSLAGSGLAFQRFMACARGFNQSAPSQPFGR